MSLYGRCCVGVDQRFTQPLAKVLISIETTKSAAWWFVGALTDYFLTNG